MSKPAFLECAILVLISFCLLSGCGGATDQSADEASPKQASENGTDATAAPANATSVQSGIETFAWSPAVLSGDGPLSALDVAALASQEVKSLLCVDSAGPPVEFAAKHGIRCFHVPIAYDELSDETRAKLALIARDATTPIYIYAFDNSARGAIAAAIVTRERNEITTDMLRALLKKAGARERYIALWNAALEHEPGQSIDAALDTIPAQADVAALPAHMAKIGRAWQSFGQWRGMAVDDKTPPLPINMAPMTESAEMLAQHFSELAGGSPPLNNETFARLLRLANLECQILTQLVDEGDADALFQAVNNLSRTCRDCHHTFRNGSFGGRSTAEE